MLSELLRLDQSRKREAPTAEELEDVRRSAQASILAAERADGAQRRAALEVEKEREAGTGSDRRAEMAEKKSEKLQVLTAAHRDADASELKTLAAELASATARATGAHDELARERVRNAELQLALDAAREAAARSAQDATTVRELLVASGKIASQARTGGLAKRARARPKGLKA